MLPSVEQPPTPILEQPRRELASADATARAADAGFTSPGHAQRFLSAYGPIAQHFRPRRHRLPAPEYRQEMAQRFQIWREITGTVIAA